MRYRALNSRQALITQDGRVKYQFENYSLIVGTPTGTGSGNEIDPDLAGTDPASIMQILYPLGATDLEKVGMDTDKLFIEAPPITAAGTLAAVSTWYELIDGQADMLDAAYVGNYNPVLPLNYCDGIAGPGLIIEVTSDIAVPADGSTWALTWDPARLTEEEWDVRCEFFKINNLSAYKDEMGWDPTKWGTTQTSILFTRG